MEQISDINDIIKFPKGRITLVLCRLFYTKRNNLAKIQTQVHEYITHSFCGMEPI